MFDLTSTQGLLKRAPLKSCSTKPTDDAAFQQYLKQALESTSHQDLIKHSIPSGWKKAAGNLPDDLVTDNTSLDNHMVLVHTHATAHVSQYIPEISPHIIAAWGNHPNWAKLCESIVADAALAAQFGYPWNETAHVKRLTSLWEHQRLLAVEKLSPVSSGPLRSRTLETMSAPTAVSVTSPSRRSSKFGAPRLQKSSSK